MRLGADLAADGLDEAVPHRDVVLLLGGVALELVAAGLGGQLGRVGAELGERLGRVAVLAGVARQLVGAQLAGGPAKVEGVLEHVVLGAALLDPVPDVGGAHALRPLSRCCRGRRDASGISLSGRKWDAAAAVRPPRDDIAAPPFPPGLEWLGGREPKLDKLVTVGPLLVHFFDFAQLNSVRALDYVREWRRPLPRRTGWPCSASTRRARRSRARRRRPSRPRCRGSASTGRSRSTRTSASSATTAATGWPSLFLWGKGGALRWYHLGEGEYAATEEAIREQLGDRSNGGLARPARAASAPATSRAPRSSPRRPSSSPGGSRTSRGRGRRRARGPDYEAAGGFAAAAAAERWRSASTAVRPPRSAVDGPGLYELAAGERHGEHRLDLRAPAGVEIHSIQFAPGPPG